MGVEPFLLSSSIVGVLAQRLVRCLCKDCREAYAPDDTELALLSRFGKPELIYRPVGCPAATRPGYRGAPASTNCWKWTTNSAA